MQTKPIDTLRTTKLIFTKYAGYDRLHATSTPECIFSCESLPTWLLSCSISMPHVSVIKYHQVLWCTKKRRGWRYTGLFIRWTVGNFTIFSSDSNDDDRPTNREQILPIPRTCRFSISQKCLFRLLIDSKLRLCKQTQVFAFVPFAVKNVTLRQQKKNNHDRRRSRRKQTRRNRTFNRRSRLTAFRVVVNTSIVFFGEGRGQRAAQPRIGLGPRSVASRTLALDYVPR